MNGQSAAVGLCATCRHARRIESRRGSVFMLCARANDDPRYPRYPPLPRFDCPGFEPTPAPSGVDG